MTPSLQLRSLLVLDLIKKSSHRMCLTNDRQGTIIVLSSVRLEYRHWATRRLFSSIIVAVCRIRPVSAFRSEDINHSQASQEVGVSTRAELGNGVFTSNGLAGRTDPALRIDRRNDYIILCTGGYNPLDYILFPHYLCIKLSFNIISKFPYISISGTTLGSYF